MKKVKRGSILVPEASADDAYERIQVDGGQIRQLRTLFQKGSVRVRLPYLPLHHKSHRAPSMLPQALRTRIAQSEFPVYSEAK